MATQTPQKVNLSPQQRAANFAQATRQTYQTMRTYTADSENDTIQIQLPKARLLSKVILQVEATVTLAGAGATIDKHAFSPFGILRRISLDMNNGFMPYILSGKDAYLYALNRFNPDVLVPGANKRHMVYVENASSVAGTDNKIKFDVHLPLTLNDRDPIGLILLQNEETVVNVTVDVGQLKDAYVLKNGETATFKNLTITPLVETYTIPPSELAFPDISVLKIVQAKQEQFPGGGQNVVTLQTGTIYRKLALYFEDSNGNPLTDDDFASNLELVFNTADTPISIKPSLLASKNHHDFGYPMPAGVYIFDFSFQGIPNLGGTRDYVDTERLTEFWLRFNTQKAGKVTIVPETLSRLA